MVQFAKDQPRRGITFKSGAVDWSRFVVLSVTDASHADEVDLEIGGPYLSQGGNITGLASASIVAGDDCTFHPIGISSNRIKRTCRSTVQAETYETETGAKSADVLRSAMQDMIKPFHPRRWEQKACEDIQCIWLTVCESTIQAETHEMET